MSKYFSYFPTIEYDIEKNNINNVVTNIIRRFHIKNSAMTNGAVFYDYEIKDGDRPDIIAEKVYGDANLAWVVLYYNNIVNPLFDFPLSSYEFEQYLVSEYGSLDEARAEVHHYEQIIEAEHRAAEGDVTKPERVIIVDETTYTSLPIDERKIVYAYEYESLRNDAKRNIKLISPIYIGQILEEVKKVFN